MAKSSKDSVWTFGTNTIVIMMKMLVATSIKSSKDKIDYLENDDCDGHDRDQDHCDDDSTLI